MLTNPQTGAVLATTDDLAIPPLSFSNGLKFDADGYLVITTTNAIESWNNGLPFDYQGSLCVSIE